MFMQYFCFSTYYNLDCTIFPSKTKFISLPALGWQNSWDANKVQIPKEGNACVTFYRFKDAILTQFKKSNVPSRQQPAKDFTQK